MIRMLGALCGALVLLIADHELGHVAQEEITKSYPFPAGGTSRQLVVDNINGSIKVTGYSGSDVQLIAHRTSYGDSPATLLESKEKIGLDILEEPGKLTFFVRSPWRCDEGCESCGCRRDRTYDADFDFEIKVPESTDLFLKTVNRGGIAVRNVTGAFEMSNVNGEIAMSGIAGAGLATTVNGRVAVEFRRNPEARCGFRTVNGSIDVSVPDELGAVLRLKTFNGAMFTDFDVTGLPRNPPVTERDGHKTIYRGDQYASVRAGRGGPEMIFETLNGDIHILKSHH